ncbi:MAG: AraC family transcriptional regulator [Lachnospiraceae bacterium]|nr:AraC family transcriptional regulator [Lachnospiraceae bacterium]
MELHKIYHPITATPFKRTEEYMEFEPCDVLKPYIRCFWGSRNVVMQEESQEDVIGIVTPDTCMDIIFTTDFTNNKIYNKFCGIDDRTIIMHEKNKEKRATCVFAIRFYAWGVPMFAEESMRNTKNNFFDAGYHFPGIKREIEKRLFDVTDINQLIPIVENLLLKRFNDRNKNPIVFQAASKILEKKGNLLMANLKQEVFIGIRQLERLFLEYVGVSPKNFASMVRYQYVWSDFLYNKNFNIADAVYKYGYSDQAHLCRDFKKYHSMSMSDARKYAMQNVGNIQDRFSES